MTTTTKNRSSAGRFAHVRYALLMFCLCILAGARVAAAQGVSFGSVQASSGGTAASVAVDLYGAYGQDEWCDEYGSCYYYGYDDQIDAGSFTFAVDGAAQSGVTVTSTPPAQCTYWSLQSLRCEQTYRATGIATTTPGTRHTMVATIRGLYNGRTGSDTYLYDAPQALLPAAVSTAPQNGDNRDLALCGATCFELTAGYTTVPYVSLDQPRAVTLAYIGRRAHRTALVQVDAQDVGSTAPPTRLSLKLLQRDGTYLTYPNGQEEAFFQYQAGAGPNRLGVRVNFNTGTGVYRFQAVVTSHWDTPSGTSSVLAAPVPVQFLYVDGYDSPYGWGWDVAGAQQLRFIGAAGTATDFPTDPLLVWDGSGTVQYFRNVGCDYQRCSYAPPAGEFSTVEYLDPAYRSAPDRAFVRKYADGTRVYFNRAGMQAVVSDPAGNETTYNWYDQQRLASIVDPAGGTIAFQYDGRGKLSAIRDAANRVTSIGIDGNGDLVSIVDGRSGGVAAFGASYDVWHLLRTTLDARGQQTDYGYDLMLRLASVTLPTITANGQDVRPTVRFDLAETRALPNWWAAQGTATNPASAVTGLSNLRDGLGNIPDRVTDPRGHVTFYTHDRYNAATSVSILAGGGSATTYIARDEHGRPVRVQEPTGRVSNYEYDGANLQRAIDSTANRSTSIYYGANARPSRVMASDGPGTWYDRWDTSTASGALRPDSLRVRVDGASGVSRVLFDARGRVLETGDPAAHPTRYYYGTSGFQNTDSVTTAFRRTTRFTYDGVGRVVSTRDAAGNIARADYDALNRMVRAIGPMNDTTTYGYDALFLRSVRDAKGQSYGFDVNALGWVETETDPRGAVTRAAYDAAGNAVSTTDRRGRTVTATYSADPLGTLIARTADAATTTFAVDPFGRFTATANGESTDTIYFDMLGRKTSEVSWRSGVRHAVVSQYDARGYRTGVIADGFSTLYDYNALGQLDTLTDVSGRKTVVTYDADGLRVSTRLPWGLTVSTPGTASHGAGEIRYSSTTIDNALGTVHTYDPLARLRDRLSVNNGYNQVATAGREFRYDAVGRLGGYAEFSVPRNCYQDPETKERTCNPGDKTYSGATAAYLYDAVGNRTDNAAVLQAGNRLTHFGDETLDYHTDGSLRWRFKDGCPAGRECHHEFGWNSLGQLAYVWIADTGTVSYGYDGWGRRIRRSWPGNAYTRHEIYDGDQLVLQAEPSGGITQVYTNYPGVDRPHSLMGGGVMYYFQQDASDNVTGVIRSDGLLMATYRYDPFGRLVDSTGSMGGSPPPLRFKGQEQDHQTKLVYMRARWYDPSVGRFISEDPIGLAGGINPYAFAGNDPVNFSDPYGTCPQGQELQVQIDTDTGEWTAQCSGGGAVSSGTLGIAHLPPVVTTAQGGWGFSTRRESGATSNFGNPNARGGDAMHMWAEREALQSPGLLDPVAWVSGLLAGPVSGALGWLGIGESAGARGILTGFTKHGIDQVINRRVAPAAIADALRYGESITRFDQLGRISFRFVGPDATVALNRYGQLITAWPKGW